MRRAFNLKIRELGKTWKTLVVKTMLTALAGMRFLFSLLGPVKLAYFHRQIYDYYDFES